MFYFEGSVSRPERCEGSVLRLGLGLIIAEIIPLTTLDQGHATMDQPDPVLRTVLSTHIVAIADSKRAKGLAACQAQEAQTALLLEGRPSAR
jgi:hypothetical protein